MLSPEYWSAIATPPTTIMTAPSSAAGPTCCGTSTTSAPATPMLRHWPSGPTPSTGFTTGPKPALIPRPSGGAPPNWPWNANCWPSASPSGRPVGNPGQAVPAHRAPHQRTLRLRGRTRSAFRQQRRRAQPAPSGHQPQGQRRHPVGAGHRAQDDAGIHLRHLARPRSKSSRRLPSVARFPSTLNCYGCATDAPVSSATAMAHSATCELNARSSQPWSLPFPVSCLPYVSASIAWFVGL